MRANLTNAFSFQTTSSSSPPSCRHDGRGRRIWHQRYCYCHCIFVKSRIRFWKSPPHTRYTHFANSTPTGLEGTSFHESPPCSWIYTYESPAHDYTNAHTSHCHPPTRPPIASLTRQGTPGTAHSIPCCISFCCCVMTLYVFSCSCTSFRPESLACMRVAHTFFRIQIRVLVAVDTIFGSPMYCTRSCLSPILAHTTVLIYRDYLERRFKCMLVLDGVCHCRFEVSVIASLRVRRAIGVQGAIATCLLDLRMRAPWLLRDKREHGRRMAEDRGVRWESLRASPGLGNRRHGIDGGPWRVLARAWRRCES